MQSVVKSGGNSNSSKLLWLSLLPARIQKIYPLKTEGTISPIVSLWSRVDNNAVCFRIWPKFELYHDFMVVLVTCKNEEDPIKTEGTSVATSLYAIFSNVQGQITMLSMVGSGRN